MLYLLKCETFQVWQTLKYLWHVFCSPVKGLLGRKETLTYRRAVGRLRQPGTHPQSEPESSFSMQLSFTFISFFFFSFTQSRAGLSNSTLLS